MRQIKEMINGKDPKKVFYDECNKRNVNPDTILGMAKTFRNLIK